MFAKAFGTIPIHDAPEGKGPSSEGEKGVVPPNSVSVEPLDPSPVLEFLTHLGVSRHEVHVRVAAALRLAIEDEIQRIPLPPSPLTEGMTSLSAASTSLPPLVGEAGHHALLDLLKSSWQFRDVPELRPILVCLLKRLGEHTPVQMLRRLGAKKADSEELKNVELMSQLGISMRRLVWEADWDAKIEAIANCTEENMAACEEAITLRGTTILADLIKDSVQSYTTDVALVASADLAFVRTMSERRYITKLRRTKDKLNSSDALGSGGEVPIARGTLAAIGGLTGSKATGQILAKEESPVSSSAQAVSTIKEVIGNRPKLLGAVLDMLISEYATTGGGIGRIQTLSNSQKREEVLKGDRAAVSILGGATNLSCSLAADIILSFGQLPRSYEVIGIMARILDTSVNAGFISDDAFVQVQGCLRTIFRPEQLEQTGSEKCISEPEKPQNAAKVKTPKIKLSTKQTKTNASIFPDTPADDSDYEKKLLQRVLKTAIASMRENDPQSLFLNPVTDAIAPGYSTVIKTPMCIRTMEEKMMSTKYTKIEEFKEDTFLMFANCVKYNTGPSGQWFRNEAGRQKKLWKETIFPDAKAKLKADMTKRKKALAQAKAAESGEVSGSKKRKPPPPLAFAPVEKGEKGNSTASAVIAPKEGKDDAAIIHLRAKNVNPLPAWSYKRRRKDVDFPSMQCLASMLLADPFVMRVIMDKIERILRIDVIKEKGIPSGHPLLPSLIQVLNIAQLSMQICALKGKHLSVPDAGIENILLEGNERSLPYDSLRKFVPLFGKMLLDADLDKRMAAGGDLHDVALQALISRPEIEAKEWEGATLLHGLLVVVEGALVHLLQPGNSNELALRDQFPRFVSALDRISGGNMLNERPFLASLAQTLLRYKSKLPHSTRDLVTNCMISWLKMGGKASPKMTICSSLHESFMNLLNEWSSLGNLVLPRDLFLSLAEQAVAAAGGVDLGKTSKAFVKLWTRDDESFSSVKNQYLRMLSTTPDAKAAQWQEKMGICEMDTSTSKTND